MMRKALILPALCLMLLLAACSGSMGEDEYASKAEKLMSSGERSAAMKLLREGVYAYPDSYEMNLLMGRLLQSMWRGAQPRSRGLYLSRHYLRRAESLAPDEGRASEARAAYESVRELQGLR